MGGNGWVREGACWAIPEDEKVRAARAKPKEDKRTVLMRSKTQDNRIPVALCFLGLVLAADGLMVVLMAAKCGRFNRSCRSTPFAHLALQPARPDEKAQEFPTRRPKKAENAR